MLRLSPLFALLFLAAPAFAQAWTDADTEAVTGDLLTIRFEPDLSGLSEGKQKAVEHLLAAGQILQDLYEEQVHPDAAAVRAALVPDSPEALLYRLFKGPVGTTSDNRSVAFAGGARPPMPERAMYPEGVTVEEVEAFLAEHPERRDDILGLRTAVHRATPEAIAADLKAFRDVPGLALFHPEAFFHLTELSEGHEPNSLYAVPYAVAYSNRLMLVRQRLLAAASAIADEDSDFAAYLRLRANDLLTGNYEGGDAAWVTGQFNNLNVQVGSYETYDDALFGVKAFYGLSLLARDAERSEELAAALTDIQALENSLPYDRHKGVRSQIPVSVYNVIADFGQARGTNTATILPNEADHARKYGRTILLRYNVLTDPQLFAGAKARFCAGVMPEHCDDLTLPGNFQRTLWHEVGHYLGVDKTDDGRNLGPALQRSADLLEEMKSDLVSLFVARQLGESGYYTPEALRSVYASGVLRVLQSAQPRREQAYQTMQLMQWNYFMENDLLAFDPASGRIAIDYDRYHDVVAGLLREVLAVQSAGDPDRAEAFVERYTTWDENLHGRVAAALKAAPSPGYRLVRYAELGE
ncbi:hypothetical protein [Rubricoccus marinus]|uniref:NUDIX hydrolase n=1 Tax=Rubricoccus marinus TaxID=716817 RepID=A0A259TWY4_9BACT|nr:hypothetical protein [Rubricoccus marinus]OZC02137.1 hypothetical protein BSZ36_03530 [Rubricoccus marinus]